MNRETSEKLQEAVLLLSEVVLALMEEDGLRWRIGKAKKTTPLPRKTKRQHATPRRLLPRSVMEGGVWWTPNQLAKEFGVGRSTVARLLKKHRRKYKKTDMTECSYVGSGGVLERTMGYSFAVKNLIGSYVGD